ncbi:MAG TPA: acyl-CoA dehydrogenase family protein [Pseudolabrys sp.]|jgi:glutaryl-CoA dehydrogenase|nr:acyl-CoA dehydrogenase family protein [Pseudolabrys sp.]
MESQPSPRKLIEEIVSRRPLSGPPHAVDGDFYKIANLVGEADRALLGRVRAFAEEKVAPIINQYWGRAEFPFELVSDYGALGIAGAPYTGFGCLGRSPLVDGLIMMELARIDCSIATFHGVHSGLAMGSIYLCGSDEQKQRWLPAMQQAEKIGAFGLTEPDVGSGAARGLTTTAQRRGKDWSLNGQKRWIGNATFADLTIIWARDVDDGQVKAFVVEKGTAGFSTEKMKHKMALRVVQNAMISLQDCRVSDENRLANARTFKDTAAVLRMTRAGVAWEAVGCAQGAYEHALRYACQREQFGRPIAGFQLVQDLLVRMLSNVTASQCMALRLSQLQDAGSMSEEHASLAKAFCTVRARETVGWARELLGGNGILLDYDVARFVADAEAIYSYEGTREINSLVVGRAITGMGAFV